MPFALVLFVIPNELAVIPVGWLKGQSCVWPNCRGKDVGKFVVTNASPEPDWLSYEVKILSIYETYEEARKHERKAEDLGNSSIDTDPGALGRGFRKRKFSCKRKFSTSTSSEEDEPSRSLPIVPDLSTCEVPAILRVYTPPNENQSERFLPQNDMQGPNHGSQESSIVKQDKLTDTRLLKEMLQLKLVLREQGQVLNNVLNLLNILIEKGTVSEKTQQIERHFSVTLPMAEYEDILLLENDLSEEEMRENLCAKLAQVGGVNLGNAVRRMMTKVISNEVAMRFSWLGAKGKEAFSNLRLSKVMFDAVRRNKAFEDTQDSGIEAVIKDWLRHAKARNKS